MSLDRSLRSANALVRHRNVLTRAERLDKLAEEEKWNESKSPFGLPKVAHRKLEVAKPVKEEVPAEGAAAPGAPGGEDEGPDQPLDRAARFRCPRRRQGCRRRGDPLWTQPVYADAGHLPAARAAAERAQQRDRTRRRRGADHLRCLGRPVPRHPR